MSKITLFFTLLKPLNLILGYIESSAGDQNDIRDREFHRRSYRKLSGPWLSSLIFVQNTILYFITLGMDTQSIEK